MGYSTDFGGELVLTAPLSPEGEAKLVTILGEDIRDHKDWVELVPEGKNLTHIDLEYARGMDDLRGIQWNGSEKTYDLVEKTNFVIDLMKAYGFELKLEGSLLAQGEDMSDRWRLTMVNGRATREEIIEIDENSVSITRERYAELECAENTLNKLRAGGVDNWDGYEAAME